MVNRECGECNQLFDQTEMIHVTAHDWDDYYCRFCYQEREKRIREVEIGMLRCRKTSLERIKGAFL